MNHQARLSAAHRVRLLLVLAICFCSGMVGKWHLDASPSSVAWIKRNPQAVRRMPGRPLVFAEQARLRFSPAGQGFDEFYMNARERRWANFRADGSSLKPSGEWITETTGDRLDDETAGALAFIERNHARPFFLYLAYSGPHTPLAATPERLARFPSHNAPQLGEKGMLTEGSIRVPFLWSWKGVLPAGKVFDHPVSSLDIAATVLAAVGIEDRDGLDGVNLLPHLTGENPNPPHEILYWRFWKQAAVRAGQWKLLHLGDGTDFLFDLSQPDPETRNLAAQHPEKTAELHAKLEAWTQQLRPPGLPKNGIQRERT